MKLYVTRDNSIAVEEGYEYKGWIESYKIVDDEKLWVYVVLDDDENYRRLYAVYINTNENSKFVNFCEEMGIIDDNDEIRLEWLVEFDCPVWVDFKRMKNGKMLIKSMHWDEEILEERRREIENE